MTVEIRVQAVKPVRNTFAHIARRFGDKPATRYQEATYDLQSEVNRHYKPLWDPDRDLYDKCRTAIAMTDWYALKDPRQYYYGSYTIARARQQEATDRQMEFADKHELLRSLAPAARQAITSVLIPLRHYEWGANGSMCFVAAYGWGTAVTQAALMTTMDRLGMAQHLSRIGLLVDGNTGDSLAAAKEHWIALPQWQPLRRVVENLLATRDWFEVLVAQALVGDSLVYGLFYQQLGDWLARRDGVGLSTVLDHLTRWQDENVKWVDAVVKPCVAESPDNKAAIEAWAGKWRAAFVRALAPLAEAGMGADGAAALAAVDAGLGQRLATLGLDTTDGGRA